MCISLLEEEEGLEILLDGFSAVEQDRKEAFCGILPFLCRLFE